MTTNDARHGAGKKEDTPFTHLPSPTPSADKIAELKEMLGDPNNPEPLHPDLAACLTKSTLHNGQQIHHPLLIDLFYHPAMNRMTNKRYAYIKAETDLAFEKGDFEKFVWRHERPYRLEAFSQAWLTNRMPSVLFAEMLGALHTDTENLWQNKRLWLGFWKLARQLGQLEKTMDEIEVAALEKLPAIIRVYRGCMKHNRAGLSWTTDKDKALWFARRFNTDSRRGQALVLHGAVAKRDVFAYLLGRGECEIVTDPAYVAVKKTEVVK